MDAVTARRGLVAVVAAALLLTGCQADWDGARRLAEEPCPTAAGLWELADDGSTPPGHEGPGAAELATALDPHVPAELDEVLAVLRDAPGDDAPRAARALVALKTWAVATCGAALAGPASAAELPTLADLPVIASEADGRARVSVSGALDPDHALLLCAHAQRADPEADVFVSDADGFLLAYAERGGECAYNPLLLED